MKWCARRPWAWLIDDKDEPIGREGHPQRVSGNNPRSLARHGIAPGSMPSAERTTQAMAVNRIDIAIHVERIDVLAGHAPALATIVDLPNHVPRAHVALQVDFGRRLRQRLPIGIQGAAGERASGDLDNQCRPCALPNTGTTGKQKRADSIDAPA